MLDIVCKFYERKYKLLMIIPLLILLFSGSVLFLNKIQTGEFIKKDVTLKGGLLITAQINTELNPLTVAGKLEDKIGASVSVKKIYSVGAGEQLGYTFETAEMDSEKVKAAISDITGFKFEEGEYTIETTSSALSTTFWESTIRALILAFVFMAIVVFFYFRKLIPCLAIILAAASDILAVLALINVLDIKLSTAGVAALLMLIGYSVDTDILLSTHVLKRTTEGSLIERIYRAMKTGLTLEITTLVALLAIYILSPAEVLRKIALVLILGLLIDLINTWIQNAGLLRWYMEQKESE